jgi:hypothetical protein
LGDVAKRPDLRDAFLELGYALGSIALDARGERPEVRLGEILLLNAQQLGDDRPQEIRDLVAAPRSACR